MEILDLRLKPQRNLGLYDLLIFQKQNYREAWDLSGMWRPRHKIEISRFKSLGYRLWLTEIFWRCEMVFCIANIQPSCLQFFKSQSALQILNLWATMPSAGPKLGQMRGGDRKGIRRKITQRIANCWKVSKQPWKVFEVWHHPSALSSVTQSSESSMVKL